MYFNSLLGVVDARHHKTGILNVTNEGALTWQDARYGAPTSGVGTRTAFNLGYYNSGALDEVNFKNSVGAQNTVEVARAIEGNGHALGNVAAYAKKSIKLENAGDIKAKIAVDLDNNTNYQAVTGFWGDITADNSGTIEIDATGAKANVFGAGFMTAIAGGGLDFDNSGTLQIKGGNDQADAAYGVVGVEMQYVGKPGKFRPMTLNNTGDIIISGGDKDPSMQRIAVGLDGMEDSEGAAFVINNSGLISADEAKNPSITFELYGGTDGAVQPGQGLDVNIPTHITNTGDIRGAILTAAGDDSFTQTAGSMEGEVHLYKGDDSALITGGDVSQVPVFDGGPGDDVFTTEGMDLRVYTDDSASDLTNGNNLTGWETIEALEGSTFTISKDKLSAGGPDGLIRVDGSSTADTGDGNTDDLVLDGSVELAGTLTLKNGKDINTTTITGNLDTQNGLLELDTWLEADDAPSDVLVVDGSTSGNGVIHVKRMPGNPGALTTGNGILLVEVHGDSNGVFTLPAPGYTIGGSYRYDLVKVGKNWYLQSRKATQEEIDRFDPITAIPTLGEWAMILLMAMLGGVSALRLRREGKL